VCGANAAHKELIDSAQGISSDDVGNPLLLQRRARNLGNGKKFALHRAIFAGVVTPDYVGSLIPNALFGQIAIGKARYSMPGVFIAVVVVRGLMSGSARFFKWLDSNVGAWTD